MQSTNRRHADETPRAGSSARRGSTHIGSFLDKSIKLHILRIPKANNHMRLPSSSRIPERTSRSSH